MTIPIFSAIWEDVRAKQPCFFDGWPYALNQSIEDITVEATEYPDIFRVRMPNARDNVRKANYGQAAWPCECETIRFYVRKAHDWFITIEEALAARA